MYLLFSYMYIIIYMCFVYYFNLNIMMMISFTPGRNYACRHCWIPFLLDPPPVKTDIIF